MTGLSLVENLPNCGPASYDNLVEALRQRRCVLFAGAGVSASLGLPSWAKLIEHMAQELGLGEKAGRDSYQMLAEYYRLKLGGIGGLRSWMDRSWCIPEERMRKSAIHRHIVELDFPIVYTTNYDSNLEVAYRLHGREYMKIVNVRDLARSTDDVPQIVKFHGDFEEDDSLVLTESNYFDRLSFDSPLDIKFRSDTLGRTILFIGYSMSDLNIRLLLHRLWRMWRDSGLERDRPPSYMFVLEEDPVRDAVLQEWGITVISRDVKRSDALECFLATLCKDVADQPQG